MSLARRGRSRFTLPAAGFASKSNLCFSPSPPLLRCCWIRDRSGTPLEGRKTSPKHRSRSSTHGWEGWSVQLLSAAPSLGSAQADDGLEQERCRAGRASPHPTHPPCPHRPGQGLSSLAGCKSCWSTGRVEPQAAGASLACMGWLHRGGPAVTPAGTGQLCLCWKSSEVTGAAGGTDSVPPI